MRSHLCTLAILASLLLLLLAATSKQTVNCLTEGEQQSGGEIQVPSVSSNRNADSPTNKVVLEDPTSTIGPERTKLQTSLDTNRDSINNNNDNNNKNTADKQNNAKSKRQEEGFEDDSEYEGFEESEGDLPVKQQEGKPYSGQPPLPPPYKPDGYLPQPQYEQPPPAYQQPQQNYSAPPIYSQPAYQQPAPVYEAAPVYQQQAYQQPAIVSNYSAAPVYQQPIVAPVYEQPAPVYQQPIVAPVYQQPTPVYEQPAPVYQQPAPVYEQPAQTYQQPAQTYQQPAQTYQQPAQTYQQPAQTYQPAPVYQPAVLPYVAPIPAIVSNYSQPIAVTYQSASNYSAPPVYQQPIYQQPAYKPVPVPAYKPPSYQQAVAPIVSNYSAQTNYIQPPSYRKQNYVQQQQQYPIGKVGNYSSIQSYPPMQRYSLAELVPYIPMTSIPSDKWAMYYYRATPYRLCPKNVYMNPPGPKDIEMAFVFAQQQLAQSRGATINYLNSTQPSSSWAGRHQIFSFLNQQSARMDEDGLLFELVSQYLSDRACLTKWDRYRYLPSASKFLTSASYPGTHACANAYKEQAQWGGNKLQYCIQSKYRTYDGFCNNPWHPYWGKANICHIRLLTPDYADGISAPRNSYNLRIPLPNPRLISNYIHFEIPIDSPYNLMKMQWGQFINHDITNTALSSYDGLVDCCKNPGIRGCWPIYVPPGDRFYSQYNVTCLSFIRSGVCPLCELGPRQQINKNSAYLDASHIYGQSIEQANKLRVFRGGLLRTSSAKNGEVLLPVSSSQEQQCAGVCFEAGDNRVNQHPALTALHTLLLRNHNIHARQLAIRHPNWSDEILFQEARRINIAEYQMITSAEYLPIVFGPQLTAYYRLMPQKGYTYYEPKTDPTTWNEYSTASCRFGHSQISSTFGLYQRVMGYGNRQDPKQTFRLKEWFMRTGFLTDGLMKPLINGLIDKQAEAVDPWITQDVRNHLYQSHKDHSGGDLAATNIWRGRDHGIPGYIHYVEYCFNYRVRNWKDLQLFIPQYTLNQLRKLYRVIENIDLFTGGMSERHFPGADIGPTFACVNGLQYHHLKFGDRYWFEHANQAGSFNPAQLEEIKRTTLARLLCRTAYLPQVPRYAFLQPSVYNPLINCNQVGELNYNLFWWMSIMDETENTGETNKLIWRERERSINTQLTISSTHLSDDDGRYGTQIYEDEMKTGEKVWFIRTKFKWMTVVNLLHCYC